MAQDGTSSASANGRTEAISASAERKPKVFISYSRIDMAFADALEASLVSVGFDVLIDRRSIAPGEPWQERIGRLIAIADSVVFVISPQSVASPVCTWEIDETERLSKRLFPILFRPVETGWVYARLRRLNWIGFDCAGLIPADAPSTPGVMPDWTSAYAFAEPLARLLDALNTDLGWVRAHTRLAELAAHWDAGARADELLIRGRDLAEAEDWAARRPSGAPAVTETQREFLSASRAGQAERLRRDQEQVARTRQFQRWAGVGLAAVAVLLATMLLSTVWQQRETLRREQNVFMNPIERAFAEERYDRAMRLALQVYPARGAWPWEPLSTELEGKLAGAALLMHRHTAIKGNSPTASIAVADGGEHLAFDDSGEITRQWVAAAAKEVAAIGTDRNAERQIALSPDGKRVVTVSNYRAARVWDLSTGKVVAAIEPVLRAANWSAAFSGDGRRLAIGFGLDRSPPTQRPEPADLSGEAHVLDVDTGGNLVTVKVDNAFVNGVSLAHDGRRLVTTQSDETVRVWSVETGSVVAVRSFGKRVLASVLSADGRRVVSATQSFDRSSPVKADALSLGRSEAAYGVYLWDASNGSGIADLSGHTGRIEAMAFDPRGERILATSMDGTARLWTVQPQPGPAAADPDPLPIFNKQSGKIFIAAFSHDGRRIITGSSEGFVQVWDAATGGEIARLRANEGGARRVALSADGRRAIAETEDGMTRVWDLADGVRLSLLGSGDRSQNREAKFSPDGRHILTISYDNTARLWQVDSRRAAVVFKGHEGGTGVLTGLLDAAFSADGKRVLTGGSDKTARIWDAATGRELAILRGHEGDVFRVAFSPDGKSVAIASSDSTVHLWRLADAPGADRAGGAETWNEVAVLREHKDWVRAVLFSPDGARALTHSDDKAVRLWDAASGAAVAVLGSQTEFVYAASFSPDGKRFLTVSSDKTARLWRSDDGTEIATFKGHSAWVRTARFSADGSRVVTSSDDKSARIWDAASAKELAVLGRFRRPWYVELLPIDTMQDAAFSADAKRVLTVSGDNKVRIWDAMTGVELVALAGDAGTRQRTLELQAMSAQFSPDDRLIVAAGVDEAARLWDVSMATKVFGHELREVVCSRKLLGAAREFTREDLEDPILRGLDAEDPVARDPCLRRGPLSLEFWIRLLAQWWAVLTNS